MRTPERIALLAGGTALISILYAVIGGVDRYLDLILITAIGGPIAIAAVVTSHLQRSFPYSAMLGGSVIGPLIVIVGHATGAAFAFFFLLGLADEATALLNELRIDPSPVEFLGSPWVLVLLINLAIMAPLSGEVGKGLGAALSRPRERKDAFLAGVAAGVGFAIAQNIFYVGSGIIFGGPWPKIALQQMLGVAVHPLASGLVMLGWWDRRSARNNWGSLKGFLAGVGVHALWNGSIVAIGVAGISFGLGEANTGMAQAGFGYLAALGSLLVGALWFTTRAVANDRDPVVAVNFRDGRVVTTWVLLMASILVPATIMVITFPGLYGG